MSDVRDPVRSVAIIGAGIIGLSCALELARREIKVTLFEKSWPPRGASWAAAGMLAPAFEAVAMPGHHPKLFELCDAGAKLWPDWAARLEEESGRASGYVPGPSLAVAFSDEDADRLRAVAVVLSGHDQAPRFVSDEVSKLEPSLSDQARAGLVLPSDGQADNRKTLSALIHCVEQNPDIAIELREAPLAMGPDGLDHAGHDATLLTAGWQTGSVLVRENGQYVDIRRYDPSLKELEPIGGQMLAVAPLPDGPKITVRAGHIYIVPKSDRIVIGATSEPGRILDRSEPEQIAELHAKAIEICPALARAPVLESWAGVRPGLKNHAPLIGPTKIAGLFVAAGHYRNGILLAPITAKMMTAIIVDGVIDPLAKAFAPRAQLTEQA